METPKKKTLELIKKSSSYKIIIPAKVESLIRFLCERVWDTEWSGVLFYRPNGSFEDGSLEIHCEDILPMDIGTTTYTEFDMSPDVISYMAQNPELLDCKMGLIHSHNNMSTFFSGTDIETLKEEGTDRNHFVSLIVNNAGNYTAAITRKIKFKSVRELSYEGFDGNVTLPNKEVIEGEELEYFNLEIVFEEVPVNTFIEVANRLKAIKDAKAQTASKAPTLWNSRYYGDNYSTPYSPPIFTTTPVTTASPINAAPETKAVNTSENSEDSGYVTDKLIESIVIQLITGSVTVTKLDKETKTKFINTVTARFNKRFGEGETALKTFEYWATDFIDFLIWYSVDDPEADECEIASDIAHKTIDALSLLPKSPYIEKYISIFSHYDDRF